MEYLQNEFLIVILSSNLLLIILFAFILRDYSKKFNESIQKFNEFMKSLFYQQNVEFLELENIKYSEEEQNIEIDFFDFREFKDLKYALLGLNKKLLEAHYAMIKGHFQKAIKD